MKKAYLQITVLFALTAMTLSLAVGCSDKAFTAKAVANVGCDNSASDLACTQSCEFGECFENYDYEKDSTVSIADILFVVDNSGSMSPEQKEIGQRFPSFLQMVSSLDYRIAITTTDVVSNTNSPRTLNGQELIQDGKLIEFANQRPYLDGQLSTSVEESLFLQAIKRDETQFCEDNNFVTTHCPSGDERGILAAHLTFENNYDNFLRPNGHLAVVILSDEDERSKGSGFRPFDTKEVPENFVSNFRKIYPEKSLKVHSIVIQPEDGISDCLREQMIPGTPQGNYGETYAQLTQLTNGIAGDICSDNYSQQLAEIGETVAQAREVLPCRPVNDEITVTFLPEPSTPITVTKNLEQNEILFSDSLPKNTKIRYQFRCRK